MRDLACLATHPDDYGPIQRRCDRPPRHDGPHAFHGHGKTRDGQIDEWEDQ